MPVKYSGARVYGGLQDDHESESVATIKIYPLIVALLHKDHQPLLDNFSSCLNVDMLTPNMHFPKPVLLFSNSLLSS